MTAAKLLVLIFIIFLIVGCPSEKLFQPNPSSFMYWSQPLASEKSVRDAMKECGYPNPNFWDRSKFSLDDQATQFECMKKRGFYRIDKFDFCTTFKDRNLPACK